MSSNNPSPQQIVAAMETLEALVQDRAGLQEVPEAIRGRLLAAAGRVSVPNDPRDRRLRKAMRIRERRETREKDAALVNTLGLREQRKAAQPGVPLLAAAPAAKAGAGGGTLLNPRCCYVCKVPFTSLHFFYDALCPDCGDFNYARRTPKADLTGRVAVVTGARVKIGYQAALMLLRNGATVVAVTRFPRDAAERYAREPDFSSFKDRLQVYGLDLRHIPSVEVFADHMAQVLTTLDFVVNNAAQTVRRPPGWYRHLLGAETEDIRRASPSVLALLQGHAELLGTLGGRPQLEAPADQGTAAVASVIDAWAHPKTGMGLWGSAALSQLPSSREDLYHGDQVFPTGQLDTDAQQVDLRDTNSWRLKLADVSVPELVETHLINTFAPFVLNSRLKPLMVRHRTGDKHIVNVSAMEGIFNRGTKTDRHPHTNMAKAALNMMTRTSAADYQKDGIHMNSVDTGWVTDEDPAPYANRKETELNFQPPLDAVDGAAREVDPIFSGLATGIHLWGQFLKDYKPAAW